MSKKVKDIIVKEYQTRLGGVSDAMVISIHSAACSTGALSEVRCIEPARL